MTMDGASSPGQPPTQVGNLVSEVGSPESEVGNPVQVTMDAPPERVFEVISQGWLFPSWVVGAARMRDVDSHWPAVGAKLHHSFGIWPVLINDETEVLSSSPPRHIRLRARGWPAGEATVDLRITPSRTGASTVVLSEDTTHGPGTLVPAPLRAAAIKVRNRETLRRLRFLAEGAAGSPAGRTGP